MINQAIKALGEENEKLLHAFSQVVVRLSALENPDGSPLELSLDAPIPDAFGSINKCHARIEALLGIITGISELKPDDFILVPKRTLNGITTAVSAIEAQFISMLTIIEQVESDGGLREVGDDLVLHSVNQQAHPSVDLKAHYQTADNQVDQALKSAHSILSIVSSKNYDPYSGALAGIRALEEKLQAIHKVVVGLRKDTKTKATLIDNQATATTATLAEMETQGQEALTAANSYSEGAKGSATEAAQGKEQITSLLTDITSTQQQATELKGQVEALQPIFEEFRKKLDDRNATFESGKKEFDDLREKMLAASEENDKLIQSSKDALGWTTASGLAGSFSTSAEELVWPLRLSRWGFYLSILLLFVSAAVAFNGIPLVREYIEIPKVPLLKGGIDATLLAAVLSVLSIKIAVLLPAVLFVGFASRRHRALFHQHQLYIYKKTIASALPGFKDHAKTHQEAMAAAAFARLLFNPQEDASRDLTREAGGQWWLSRWLERIITKGMRTVMAADGKPGSSSPDT
jgi:hypothetical protein